MMPVMPTLTGRQPLCALSFRHALRSWLLLGLLLTVGCASQQRETVHAQDDIAWLAEAVTFLASPEMQGRSVGTAGHDRARDYIATAFAELGLQQIVKREDGSTTYLQQFSVRLSEQQQSSDTAPPTAIAHNVISMLPGSSPMADQLVVIAAHYDHLGMGEIGSYHRGQPPTLHPGADDNASGTAGLLLIARKLTDWRDAHPHQPCRSIVFIAFTGEERGLLGSSYFTTHARELTIDLTQITAMINLDMIGRLRSSLLVFGKNTGSKWSELLAQANTTLPTQTKLVSLGGRPAMSDHSMFQRMNVPVLHLFTGMHSDYHRPTDTADRINAAGAVQIAHLAAQLTQTLATMPTPMEFVPQKQEK